MIYYGLLCINLVIHQAENRGNGFFKMTNRSTKCTFLTGFPSSNVTLLNAAWYVYYLDLEQAGVIIFLGIWERGGTEFSQGSHIGSRKFFYEGFLTLILRLN